MSTTVPTLVGALGTVIHRAGLAPAVSIAAGYLDRGRAFPILSYHRVNDEGDPFFPSLPTALFEQQMAFVARAYIVLPVEELAERMARGALPRNALAITFDDGYLDNLTHAAPILARHGLPATVFLATGVIGTGKPLWFDSLAIAFKRARLDVWTAPWGETLPLRTTAERLQALAEAQHRLKLQPGGDRLRLVDDVLRDLDLSDLTPLKNLMMTWDDVHALSRLGIRIGAHTVTHPILSRLSEAEAQAEIRGSRAAIAAACGSAPRAFAYPNGRSHDYTDAVVRTVRDAGFTCAVTTRFGVNTSRTSPYELRRGTPWETDIPTFALKLAGYRLAHA